MKVLLFVLAINIYALPVRKGVTFKVENKKQYIVRGKIKHSSIISEKKLGMNFHLIETKEELSGVNNLYKTYTYYGDYMESVTDPMFVDQYHHEMIKTTEAWNITKGKKEVVIAVTDNEFELDHDDLQTAWWKNTNEIPGNNIDDDNNGYIDDVIGWDFVENDNNVDVLESPTHGTHVAGIIAATNNNIGVVGVAPGVKVMPLRWYGDERPWTTDLIVETYLYAIENGANIISTSYNIDGLVEDMAYRDVLKLARKKDILVFNSAGNDSKKNAPREQIEEVILVCSVKTSKRRADRKSSFSNYGQGIDICAPGDPILSTVQRRYEGKSRYGELEGTSMSTPIAASVAALIWSHNPNMNSSDVLQRLLDSADNIDDKNRKKYKGMLGAGRVNAYKALK
ncbi:MAG: S8 family serine peptidase [Bacteriovoracaceae bacterium]|jgi:subtilisin family serine protease|nr:S8 family serine peptidase [Bacteriovoracaceae bacterium]